MPVPATFMEFLASMPDGPSAHGLRIYERIDLCASLLASSYRDQQGRTAESLRALADEQMAQATTRTGRWVENYGEAQENYWRAGMCALDPRLCLRPDLWAWSRGNQLNLEWVEYYLAMLETWARKRMAERTGGANDNVDAQPMVAAAMAAE